jgi:DNA ligase (NAD+)
METIKNTIEALREKIEKLNYSYYVLSKPEVSDFEFDRLLRELEQLEAEHPEFFDPNSPTQRVGSDINKNFAQIEHIYPMLSLSNTYSEGEVQDF